MKKYVFGVDIGGTTVKLGLFDVEGDVLDKWEIPTRTENGGEKILPDIADSIREKMKQIDKDFVAGVLCSCPCCRFLFQVMRRYMPAYHYNMCCTLR